MQDEIRRLIVGIVGAVAEIQASLIEASDCISQQIANAA
jgi:hypothetical protein